MKITISLDQSEQISALELRLSKGPAIQAKNFKIGPDGTVVLDSSILKSSIAIWLKTQGHTINDNDVGMIQPDGSVTIEVSKKAVEEYDPKSAVLLEMPIPIAPSVKILGHLVASDPPLSATGKATVFGLNYDGSKDQSDNQLGFFNDPATNKAYNTGDKTLHGVSLPREVLLSSFNITDEWKTPEITDENTSKVWAKHAAAVRQFATSHKITFTIDSGGVSVEKAPLVDAGPEALGSDGCCIGNLADFTYATAHALNTRGNAVCTLELLVDGSPVEIRGWDHVNKRVG